MLIASGAAARLAPKFGRGVTMTGALVMAAGMAGLIATVPHYGAAVTTWDMVPALVVAGLGMGTVIAPLADILLAGVADAARRARRRALFNTSLQLGASVGVAVIGVIFFGLLGSQSGPARPRSPRSCGPGWPPAGVPAAAPGHVEAQFRVCLHDRLVAADPTVTPGVLPADRPGPAAAPAADQVLASSGRPRCGTTSPPAGAHALVPGRRVLPGLPADAGAARGAGGAPSPSPAAASWSRRRARHGPGTSPHGEELTMRIALLGGTGGIGGHLLSWALEAGHEVQALARDPQALAAVRQPVAAGAGPGTGR